MKIYTAASFTEQGRIRQFKEPLFKMGHSVIATWLEEQVKPAGMTDEQFGRKMAAKDLQEVAAADCVILDTESPSKTSGKMIEVGFALAKHKLIYTVGPVIPNAIFLLLADKHFLSWDELLEHFKVNHS